MPRFLDPEFKLRMVLAGDLNKNPQPAFFARTLTIGQKMQIQKTIEEAPSSPEPWIDVLMMCLVGWENMGGLEFTRENVVRVLDEYEIKEIIEFVTSEAALTEAQRKKFG